MHTERAPSSDAPLVSVVIPTAGRPDLVTRAVKSVLAQTLARLEVIVVVDGHDRTALDALSLIHDPRLGVIMLPSPSGAACARNAGVASTRAPWVAFLDDDDLWMPEKLEKQIRTAESLSHRFPVITCRVIAKNEFGKHVWPRNLPKPGEHLSEYLFCSKAPFGGEGLILTSSLLTPRELLRKVPFTEGIRQHSDIEWLLRVARDEDVCFEFADPDNPLAVWNIEERRKRISTSRDWRYSLSCIQTFRELITRRAYASFVLTWVGLNAKRAGDWKAFFILPCEAMRNGAMSLNDIVSYLGTWLIPRGLGLRIALLYDRIFWKKAKGGNART